MKKTLKALAVGGAMAMLAGGGLLASANVSSDAVIQFIPGQGPDLAPSNARIVDSALDLSFGVQEIDNNHLHWNSQSFWSQNGTRHITVLDEVTNSAGWALNVRSTGFQSDEAVRREEGWYEWYGYTDEEGNWREGQRWVDHVWYEHAWLSTDMWFSQEGLDSTNHENVWSWAGPSLWGGSTSRVATGAFGSHRFNFSGAHLTVHSGQIVQPGTYRNTLTWSIEIAPVFNNGGGSDIGGNE